MIKPDIVQVLEREGFHVQRNKINCPFHDDKRPSLYIYRKTNSWYCFPCNSGGDAIAFVMRYKGMTFKDALKYLSIPDYQPQATSSSGATKQRLIEQFRQWEQTYHNNLCTLFRTIQNHKKLVKCMNDINVELYHDEPIIEYRLDILVSGNDKQKFELYREVHIGYV